MKKLFISFCLFFWINTDILFASQPSPDGTMQVNADAQLATFIRRHNRIKEKMHALSLIHGDKFGKAVSATGIDLSAANKQFNGLEKMIDLIIAQTGDPNKSPKHQAPPSAPVAVPAPKKASAASALMVAASPASAAAAASSKGADQKATAEDGYEKRKAEQQQRMAHISAMAKRPSVSSPPGTDTLSAEILDPKKKFDRLLHDDLHELLELTTAQQKILLAKMNILAFNADKAKTALFNLEVNTQQLAEDKPVQNLKKLFEAIRSKDKTKIGAQFAALNTLGNQKVFIPDRISNGFTGMNVEDLEVLHTFIESVLNAAN